MEVENSSDITSLLICLTCLGTFLIIVATSLWIGLRQASGKSALPSNPKELINTSKGAASGLIGGLIGGSIYAGITAMSIFPNEKISLVNGIIVWAIFGGLLGIIGGGIGGFVNNRRYGQSRTLMDWAMVGAMFGPLILGMGAMMGMSLGGMGVSIGGEAPLLVIVGGTFLGAVVGAYFQENRLRN
jgi:hypothetical protein